MCVKENCITLQQINSTMAKEKIKCVVRGKILELSPNAYEMAKQYFGAQRLSDLVVPRPIELNKPLMIPKPLKPVADPVVETPIELKKTITEVVEHKKRVAKRKTK